MSAIHTQKPDDFKMSSRRKSRVPETHFLRQSSLPTTHVSGPIGFLNPTFIHFKPGRVDGKEPIEKSSQSNGSEGEEVLSTSTPPPPPSSQPPSQPNVEYLWRSRDNRKGRHAVRIQYSPSQHGPDHTLPASTKSVRVVLATILRMATFFPVWDVSWLVATSFTLGSMIWCINAFFVWLPLQDPSTQFAGEVLTGGGVTAFIGATIFEIGSILLLLEAVNENHTACFGWAVETVVKRMESHQEQSTMPTTTPSTTQKTKVRPLDQGECSHHHVNKRSFLRDGVKETSPEKQRSFEWFPSWTELKDHYFHELGFWASLVQFVGASIFWIAGFTGLPGITNVMGQNLTDGVYWTPQIVGGLCFVISGLLFTIETQPNWYIPAPGILGWHIGAWNTIGGVGFTLCGALGPASTSSGVQYQSTLATFWGSWAFLIGSIIQWYESLDKFPVQMDKADSMGSSSAV